MLASAIQALVLAGISSAFTPQQIDRVLSDIQQSAARGGVRVGRKSVGVGMGAGAGGIAKVRRGGKVLEFNEASPGNNIDPTNQMTFFRYKQYDLSTTRIDWMLIFVYRRQVARKNFEAIAGHFPTMEEDHFKPSYAFMLLYQLRNPQIIDESLKWMCLKLLRSMITRQPDVARRAHVQTRLEQMGLPYIVVDLIGSGERLSSTALSLLLSMLNDGRYSAPQV